MQRINSSQNIVDIRKGLAYRKGGGYCAVCRILLFSFLTIVFIYCLINAFRAPSILCANKSMWNFWNKLI